MSDQSNQAPPSALTPEELRKRILDQLSIEQKVIEELSGEELDIVAGGARFGIDSGELVIGRDSTKPKIPKAYVASAAGLAAGGTASFTVGLVGGKLSVSG